MRSPSSLRKPATPPSPHHPWPRCWAVLSTLGAPTAFQNSSVQGVHTCASAPCPGTRWQLIRSRRCLLQGCTDIASRLDYHSCLQHRQMANTGRATARQLPSVSAEGTVTRRQVAHVGSHSPGNSRAWVQRHPTQGQSFCSSARGSSQSLQKSR